MKTLLIVLVGLTAYYSIQAEAGGKDKIKPLMGSLSCRFNNHALRYHHKDSILIIFDGYDHSHAGALLQICHADSNHRVFIPEIPAGKYYVTIKFLGIHHDQWEKTIRIWSKRCGILKLRLENCEEFTKAELPAFTPDFADLSVVRLKADGGARQRKSRPLY